MVFGFWEFQGLRAQQLYALGPKPASATLESRMQNADATGQDPQATPSPGKGDCPFSGPSQSLGSLWVLRPHPQLPPSSLPVAHLPHLLANTAAPARTCYCPYR